MQKETYVNQLTNEQQEPKKEQSRRVEKAIYCSYKIKIEKDMAVETSD